MAQYQYTAIDNNGRKIKNSMEAANSQELIKKLEEQMLYCIRFEDISENKKNVTIYRMRHSDVVIFCRQMKAMLTAGITISRIFDILQDKTINPKQKGLYRNVYEQIQMGDTLSSAMQHQGKSFPSLLIQMVASGETSGTLDEIVGKMEGYYNNEMKLLNKMRTAMIYPIVLLAISIAVIVLLFQFVLPKLFTMFGSENLAASTKVLIAISSTLSKHWPIVLILFLAFILLLNGIHSTKRGRLFFDRLKIRLPVFGKLFRIIYTARFANSIATLYSSGVTVIHSLEISCDIIGNMWYSKKFATIIEQVRQGGSLAVAAEESKLFDSMFTSLIFIGEESGNLDNVLNQASDYYDTEAQLALERMVAMIEPSMIVVLAIIIGVVVVSVITPIYRMYQDI